MRANTLPKVNLKKLFQNKQGTIQKEKEKTGQLTLLKQEPSLQVSGSVDSEMAMVFKFGLTVLVMKVFKFKFKNNRSMEV